MMVGFMFDRQLEGFVTFIRSGCQPDKNSLWLSDSLDDIRGWQARSTPIDQNKVKSVILRP